MGCSAKNMTNKFEVRVYSWRRICEPYEKSEGDWLKGKEAIKKLQRQNEEDLDKKWRSSGNNLSAG